MAKSVPMLGVQPTLLKWARESAHLSLDEVAAKFKKTVEVIEDWESGAEAPSYPQLEKLAYSLYKRPLALFFLPSPPVEPKPEVEFRALPDADLRRLRRETVLLIRRAHAQQASLIELFNNRSPVSEPIWNRIRLDASKPIIPQARAVRSALAVFVPGSEKWGETDGDVALKVWRKAIEANGVFVFKDTFKQKEISGFCLEHPQLPVVMINNSVSKTRQIFSLLHELSHILLNRRAISTFDETRLQQLSLAEQKIERFCNQIAAEILVPSDDFSTQTLEFRGSIENLRPENFELLAERYHVSREVILRIFLDAGRVGPEFYERRKAEWDGQRSTRSKSGGNYYATKGQYLSERLMSEVFARYGRRQITVDEAANFIGVKAKQIDELENKFLRGLAA